MSFSINEDKVAELLKSAEPGYAVFTSDVPVPVAENYVPATSETFGAVYSAPVLVTAETKEQLMAARRKIEESGFALKNPKELTKEIDEMRGRR
jgi:hypothetical protein